MNELAKFVQTEVQSPFLPGTKIQYAWDSTSLGLLKTCSRLYQYIMLEGWSPKGESVHLRFGHEYHKALEDYDRYKADGLPHEEAIRATVLDTLRRTVDYAPDEGQKAGRYKSRKNLISLVIDYLDKYREDPAQTVILDNGVPAVELSFRFELDWGPKVQPSFHTTVMAVLDAAGNDIQVGDQLTIPTHQPYLLSGHLDRVVSFNDELFVMDRKTTTTTLGPYYFDQYAPNNQMTLYTLAGKIMLESPIKGVIIDAAQILLDKPNHFSRGLTYRTQDQLDEWVGDLTYWFSLAEQFAVADYWPMNDTACDKFGGCRFRSVCAKSPQVRETYLKADFEKLDESSRWNPLRPR